MRRVGRLGERWATVVWLVATGCNVTGESVSIAVGSEGASVLLPDGGRLTIPPAVLRETVNVRVTKISAPRSDEFASVGTFFRFEPSGTDFISPAIIRFAYDPNALPEGTLPEELRVVWTRDDGTWEALPSTVDTNLHRVSAAVRHFSQGGIARYELDEAPGNLPKGYISGHGVCCSRPLSGGSQSFVRPDDCEREAYRPSELCGVRCCKTPEGSFVESTQPCGNEETVIDGPCAEEVCCFYTGWHRDAPTITAGTNTYSNCVNAEYGGNVALDRAMCDEICCSLGERVLETTTFVCEYIRGVVVAAEMCAPRFCCETVGIGTLDEAHECIEGLQTALPLPCPSVCCLDGELEAVVPYADCQASGGASFRPELCELVCCHFPGDADLVEGGIPQTEMTPLAACNAFVGGQVVDMSQCVDAGTPDGGAPSTDGGSVVIETTCRILNEAPPLTKNGTPVESGSADFDRVAGAIPTSAFSFFETASNSLTLVMDFPDAAWTSCPSWSTGAFIGGFATIDTGGGDHFEVTLGAAGFSPGESFAFLGSYTVGIVGGALEGSFEVDGSRLTLQTSVPDLTDVESVHVRVNPSVYVPLDGGSDDYFRAESEKITLPNDCLL